MNCVRHACPCWPVCVRHYQRQESSVQDLKSINTDPKIMNIFSLIKHVKWCAFLDYQLLKETFSTSTDSGVLPRVTPASRQTSILLKHTQSRNAARSFGQLDSLGAVPPPSSTLTWPMTLGSTSHQMRFQSLQTTDKNKINIQAINSIHLQL